MKEKKRKNKSAEQEHIETGEDTPEKAGNLRQAESGNDDENPTECNEIIESDDKDRRIEELTDKWRRTLAEFDNFRKRTVKEKTVMYDDGARDAIQKLLPVIDNFGRALISEADKESGFYKGVDMIAKQLDEYLKDMCVEEIPGVGESFDPNIHFAVSHIEDDSIGENEVVEVLQKGYRHKDKVIRPAMVKVAN